MRVVLLPSETAWMEEDNKSHLKEQRTRSLVSANLAELLGAVQNETRVGML